MKIVEVLPATEGAAPPLYDLLWAKAAGGRKKSGWAKIMAETIKARYGRRADGVRCLLKGDVYIGVIPFFYDTR